MAGTSSTPSDPLVELLPEGNLLLQDWSSSGRLTAAAQEALMLSGETQALTDLVKQWSAGVFSGVPPIVLLSARDMNGAMGAYVNSTGTIYLNTDWLVGASTDHQVMAVLTEELGHHLDGLLNAVDTPGDEGEYFGQLLTASVIVNTLSNTTKAQDDSGLIRIDGLAIPAEYSAYVPAIRGNSVYLIVSGSTWLTANTNAKSLGGELVTLNSLAEEQFVWDTFGFLLPTYVDASNPNGGFWTGLNDVTTEGLFVWSSGQTLTYTQSITINADSPLQDYVIIRRNSSNPRGFDWDDYWGDSRPYSGTAVASGVAEISINLAVLFSSSNPSEGATLQTTINLGTTAASGATIYWDFSGTGITANDFSSGVLSGSSTVGTDGKVVLTHVIANDLLTEGVENLQVKVYSDVAKALQIGSTATVAILDTSNEVNRPSNLVLNGGFQQDSLYFIGPERSQFSWNNFLPTGWNLDYGYGPDLLAADQGKFGANPSPYGQFIELDGSIDAGISQTLATVAGKTYAFSFLWSLPNYATNTYTFPDASNKFDAGINSSSLFSYDGSYGSRGSWTKQTYLFVASGPQTRIFFGEKGVSDGEGSLIDNVLVAEVAPSNLILFSSSNPSEGATLQTTINLGTTAASGATIYWDFSGTGITANDFSSGVLSGSSTVGTDGKVVLTHVIANDLLTEGVENLQVKVYSDVAKALQIGSTATVAILDTSVNLMPPTVASVSVQGSVVSLLMSEPVTAISVPVSAFAVSTVSSINTVSSLSVGAVSLDINNSSRVLLSIAGTVPASTVNLRVTYTDPAGDQSTGVVQNLGGIDLASFSNRFADTYVTSATTTLASQYLNLTLTGTTAINGTGNTLNNILTGNVAANSLNGGAGNDTMIGGLGDDTYVVDVATDVVTELAGEGTDLVQSAITFSLAALTNVENLTLTGTTAINGTGNALNNILIGNSAANSLSGGAGSDTLNGGAGNDTMIGGLGDDTYVVDVATDVVTELAGEGTDLVQSAITFSLAALTNVENLTLTGTTAINGTGNAFNNGLIGNSGANTLNGGLGNDTLTGGTGADTFRFDTALNASTNVDRITDFTPTTSTTTTDHIQLENTGTGLFTAITATGTLAATAFISGAAFTTTAQRIRYESTTGNLFYDADGSGIAQASTLFATISASLSIANTQFNVT